MKKKILIILVVILIVVVLGAGIYFILNNRSENKSLDVELAGQTLANNTPFNEMATMDITIEELNTIYGINTENVEQVVGKMPMMNVQASMYLVIKAAEGAVDSVKTKVEQYGTSYEAQWATYLPEQYELVKQRKIGVKGNYVYLIISENAADLEALIK